MSLGMIDEPIGEARVTVINAATFCSRLQASTLPRILLAKFLCDLTAARRKSADPPRKK